ncbi:MAG: TlpA disulfide reductase family protein [Planctomycetota bacterium]
MIRTFAAVVGSLAALGAAGQAVINEGTGARRAALDKMVYQPAPTRTILQKDEWIGDAPTLGDISGRPMLVFTWAEWYRPSHSVAMLAKRLGEEFPDLVVVGVHDDEGWDEAQTFAERRKLGFPVVRDTDGSIRGELKSDQDPDVYVFDRAGQVRYADITTESVRAAVQEVAGEDAAAAASVESTRAQRRADAERERRLSRGINERIDLDAGLNVPFVKPPAEEYAAVEWPTKEVSERERRRNRRGDTGPVSIAVPPSGWFNDRAPNTEGRVVVMYLWHPVARWSIDDLMVRIDDLQRTYSRDVVVVGALIPVVDTSRRRGSEPTDPLFQLPISNETIDQYVGSRRLAHYLIPLEGSPMPSLDTRNRRDPLALIGSVGIISSDGVLRRQELFTDWDDLRRALDTTLRVDPGVKARRAAEDAFIRAGD